MVAQSKGNENATRVNVLLVCKLNSSNVMRFIDVLVTLLLTVGSTYGGVSVCVRVNDNGMRFFDRAVHQIVNNELGKIELPSIFIPVDTGPGSGYINITNMKLLHFNSPQFQLRFISPDGLAVETTNASFKLLGEWQSMYYIIFPVYFSGYIEAAGSDIRNLIHVDVDASNCIFRIDLRKCSTEIEKLDVHIGGGIISWIVDLFRSSVSSYVKKLIQSQFCHSMKTSVLIEVNKRLASLPYTIQLSDNVFLHNSCVRSFRSTQRYLQMEFDADITYGDKVCHLDAPRMDFSVDGTKSMVHFWIADEIFNCIAQTACSNANFSHRTITKDIYSGKFTTLFKTSCDFYQLCIGNLISALHYHYPNKYVELEAACTTLSDISIFDGGIIVNGCMQFNMYISPRTIQVDSLLELVANVSAIVVPKMERGLLRGSVVSFSLKLTLEKSVVGTISAHALSKLEEIFTSITFTALETVLIRGMPIPDILNVTLADNPLLNLRSGFVRIDSDLTYKNSSALLHIVDQPNGNINKE